MRRSYLDYAVSVIIGRQESVQSILGLHIYVRVFVRRVLGIISSPRFSELVERCGQWKVWDEPKPSLIYLLCQKARAPPDFLRLLQSAWAIPSVGGTGGSCYQSRSRLPLENFLQKLMVRL